MRIWGGGVSSWYRNPSEQKKVAEELICDKNEGSNVEGSYKCSMQTF